MHRTRWLDTSNKCIVANNRSLVSSIPLLPIEHKWFLRIRKSELGHILACKMRHIHIDRLSYLWDTRINNCFGCKFERTANIFRSHRNSSGWNEKILHSLGWLNIESAIAHTRQVIDFLTHVMFEKPLECNKRLSSCRCRYPIENHHQSDWRCKEDKWKSTNGNLAHIIFNNTCYCALFCYFKAILKRMSVVRVNSQIGISLPPKQIAHSIHWIVFVG